MQALPTVKQLRHLIALAEHGHFGRAAHACHVTQSTLSASIKELEDILRAALVDRTKRRVVMTPLGHATVARARRVIEALEALAQAAASGREPLSGLVRLGVIPTIGPFVLPRLLPKLRKLHPRLRLELVEDTTERLVPDLHAGKLDAVLLALPSALGNVERALLFDDRFHVALPPGHALAGYEALSPAEIRAESMLLLRDGHCLRDHALAACRVGRGRPLAALEATSLYTLIQMVDNGFGITLVPELAVAAGILRGTGIAVRPLDAPAAARKVALVWRKGTGRREEFKLLAERIRTMIRPTAVGRS